MNRVSKSVIIGDDDYTYDKDGVNDFAKILVGTILSRHVHYANLALCIDVAIVSTVLTMLYNCRFF